MRGLLLAAGLAFAAAGPAAGQQAAPAAAPDPAAQPAAAEPPAPPSIEQLQRQLAAAQAELARLRATDAAVAVAQRDVCDAKNIRLIAVGRAILADYTKRYRRGLPGPLQLNRTHLETLAQDYEGQFYENRYDVPPRAQAAAPAEAEPPAKAKKTKRKRKTETKN